MDKRAVRNKEDLHELGEFVDLTPDESEVHLNGFLSLSDVVLHIVIQPRLNHIKELDKRIIHVEKYMLAFRKRNIRKNLKLVAHVQILWILVPLLFLVKVVLRHIYKKDLLMLKNINGLPD